MYTVPNNVCTDLQSGQCVVLGHSTPYKAGGAACIGGRQLEIKETVFI